jgi:hypothetical protein
MSEKIEIPYRGYAISFGHNSGLWSCRELGQENIDINKVKAGIDRVCLKLRKENAVECLYLAHEDELHPANIIEYAGHSTKKTGPFGTGPRVFESHLVYAMRPSYSSTDRHSRQRDKLDNFVQRGPLTDAILAEIKAERETIKRAEQRIHELKKQYPRVTIDDIQALVKIATVEAEAGED